MGSRSMGSRVRQLSQLSNGTPVGLLNRLNRFLTLKLTLTLDWCYQHVVFCIKYRLSKV